MKNLQKFHHRARHSRQRGSILVMTAGMLLVAVIMLTGTQLGYAFYAKRDLQKTADLAALAGAKVVSSQGCVSATEVALANAALNKQNAFNVTAMPSCHKWDGKLPEGSDGKPANIKQRFAPEPNTPNAVKVVVTGTTPSFIPGFAPITQSAEAVAAGDTPLAALTVRSTLVSVDTAKSAALNAVFGGLLGGNLSLSAVSWDGLVKTDVNLLKYLDRLAINLGVAAGQYETLLTTNASVHTLIQTGIEVLQAGGGTGTVVADAVNGLIGLRAAIPPGAPLLQLADLIKLQTGTPASGLDLGLNVFELAQGVVQLANSKNGVVADVPLVSVPGIGNVRVKLRVIEPPQLSAIGNPALAKADPMGINQIYVRTAQIRSLISVDLPGLSGVTGLLNSVLDLLSPVTSLLNNVLSLNLQQILCLGCTQTRVVLVPENPIRLSINLDVAHGDGRVTDYNCPAPGTKSLTVSATTAASNLRIGQMTVAQEAAVLTSSSAPVITPIPLLDVETRNCVVILGCGNWSKYSRTGLKADTSIAASSTSFDYENPPDLNAPPPQYHGFSTSNVVSSLSGTLSGLQLQTYQYSAGATNHFGSAIGSVTQLVAGAVSQVQAIVTSLLSPLLDPLANMLLNTLGIDLAKTELGGSLTCKGDARLVY